jgi:hypothetical protein
LKTTAPLEFTRTKAGTALREACPLSQPLADQVSEVRTDKTLLVTRSASSLHPRLCWSFAGLSVGLLGVGTGSLGQVRPGRRAIFSALSDGPVGMSKRSSSITCFLGTRKGVLTERASTPRGGDLGDSGRFAKA